LSETLPEGRQIIFGVRPCEARGANILDALFMETPPIDPYYARRREQAVLVGLACEEMGPTCFCTSVGGAPDDPQGMDVMLRAVEGGFLADAFSEKGETLLKPAGVVRDQHPAGRPASTVMHLPQLSSVVPVPEQQAWPAHYSDDYWERLGERCLSCRLCAYVCPTCRCFDLRDEALPQGGYERLRCWDSCAGAGYRRIAGGHNPRAAKAQRLRNRFMCKFYYYPEQYGMESAACTGCGRCIDYCPVGIDIIEVMAEI
jgi:ferredoxin